MKLTKTSQRRSDTFIINTCIIIYAFLSLPSNPHNDVVEAFSTFGTSHVRKSKIGYHPNHDSYLQTYFHTSGLAMSKRLETTNHYAFIKPSTSFLLARNSQFDDDEVLEEDFDEDDDEIELYDEEEEEEEEYDYEINGEYEEYESEAGDDFEVTSQEDGGEEEEEENIDDESDSIVLQDDPDDPNYMAQKKIIEEAMELQQTREKMLELSMGDESADILQNAVNSFLDEQLQEAGVKPSTVDKTIKQFEMRDDDADQILEEYRAMMDKNQIDKMDSYMSNLGTDDDVFPLEDDPIYLSIDDTPGLGKDDLLNFQASLNDLVGTMKGYTDGSLIDNKQATIRIQHELEKLDPQMVDEIYLCLNASAVDANGDEYGESIMNDDPMRWLLYDLKYNVTNLMLAACKHNPEAPLLLNHWMPQLCAYSRYADVRERGFHFTWEDCLNSDVDELLQYYQGLGYDEIPTKTPKETNIVEVDTEYDQEDITLAAFENWMDEVYNEEDEDLYFDDEEFQPEHNVFDQNYGLEDTDEVQAFMSEFREFQADHANQTEAWRETYAKETNYTHVVDEEVTKEFKGHLVVACCGSDHDLDLAEKITSRMKSEFGKKVFVETRVYNHARQEDNLYEIWLESYDIELIHSRRGAFYNNKQWSGPADVDEKQLDYIVDRVAYLISDDARYSYHLHEFALDV